MDLKDIRQMIRFLEGTQVAELEISDETQKVRITRAFGAPAPHMAPSVTIMPQHAATPLAAAAQALSTLPQESNLPANAVAIKSPMVGTLYLSPKPESPPFVKGGDMVSKGQTLCIIEAMKNMNSIEAEVAGRVVAILKETASPVEYGEDLFYIEVV